ncbi:transposable element Tcb2 transposase [Trichonephila clavipes]|nr:transposable element Tcb2 transposase [Trichonephila clavipes]
MELYIDCKTLTLERYGNLKNGVYVQISVDRRSYKGGGTMVLARFFLGGYTVLHMLHGGTLTGVRYTDEILDPYVFSYAGTIGNDFILMDAPPHRSDVVEDYL